MPKKNEATPRDLEIFASAYRYTVLHGRDRYSESTEASARDLAAKLAAEGGKGALVYAVGTACGTEASALLVAY